MLQFYLREQGLALSWVGTGRLIFSLNYDDADFDAVCAASSPPPRRCRRRLVVARCAADSNRSIRRTLLQGDAGAPLRLSRR
jgi:glutamate-1-semialdehyde 2,1-aminomutase